MLTKRKLQRRCPRLGHEIGLIYCLEENSPFPCKLILSCWSPVFDLAGIDMEKWLRSHLGDELWQSFVTSHSGPSPCLEKLIEAIEKVKKQES